jgi:hypothetical protein
LSETNAEIIETKNLQNREIAGATLRQRAHPTRYEKFMYMRELLPGGIIE